MAKYYVVCPGNIVTGGTELLHQLVNEMRSLGIDSYISYWPYSITFDRPDAYASYDAPACIPGDEAGNVIIFPETLTKLTYRFRRAQCCIWWLSVDHYFLFPQDYQLRMPWIYRCNSLYDPLRHFFALLFLRRPLFAMKKMRHYAQSHYAKSFLNARGIEASLLSDYISWPWNSIPRDASHRLDRIVFNPRKGMLITQRLIQVFPMFDFVPIEDMAAVEVQELLLGSKIYIDFGNHPGKDRLPREAVLAGCCVIVGTSGAASFEQDVPIKSGYQMNVRHRSFYTLFRGLVESILDDFSAHQHMFSDWRNSILSERHVFRREVSESFLSELSAF